MSSLTFIKGLNKLKDMRFPLTSKNITMSPPVATFVGKCDAIAWSAGSPTFISERKTL